MTEELGLYTVDNDAVPLDSISMDVRLHDQLSEVVIEQNYINKEQANIEAVYTFPLPLDAVLLELTLKIGERSLQGEVSPLAKAESCYEEAVMDGDTALLLKKLQDGLYSISLGNLQSGESALIRIRCAQLHHWQGEQLRLMIPTVIGERYGNPGAAGVAEHEAPQCRPMHEQRYQIKIIVAGAIAKEKIYCPSHVVQTQFQDGTVVISPASKRTFLDRDFVLIIEREKQTLLPASLFTAPDPFERDQHTALAMLQPEITNPEKSALSLKIIVDCSGSMQGDSIAQSRIAIESILEHLNEGDEFNIIRFGSTVELFRNKMIKVSRRSVSKALKYIAKLDANLGGTEIGMALEKSYSIVGSSEVASDILLITDGDVWDDGTIETDAVESAHRIFTVGVGSAVSESFVRNLAERSGGAAELVTPNEGMAARIVRQFERIRSPECAAAVEWGHEPLQQDTERLCRIFAVDTVHSFATFSQFIPEQAIVRYSGESMPETDQEIDAVCLPEQFSGDLLARLAAHAFIQQIDDKELETEIAVKYQLLTERTGMTAIDVRSDEERSDELSELRKVPQMAAAGWGGRGTVLECSAQYSLMDRPAFSRKDRPVFSRMERRAKPSLMLNGDYLDIPAYLRSDNDYIPSREKSPVDFVYALNSYCESWRSRILHVEWSVAQLLKLGLSSEVANALTELVDHGDEERAVVLEFIKQLLFSSVGGIADKTTMRLVLKDYNKACSNESLAGEIGDLISGIAPAGWAVQTEQVV